MGNTDLAFFSRVGTSLICTVDDLVYEILSFTRHPEGVSATVKISSGVSGTQHVDKLSLWSHKRRLQFARECQQPAWENIPKHLLTIQEQLEAYHVTMSKGNGTRADAPREMSDVEKQEATDFLKAPDLMKKILADITLLGHVGEENLKLLVYLSATSRKLGVSKHSAGKPLIVLVTGESSVGKSYLLKAITMLMPPEEVVELSSMSEKALIYLPPDYLKNKLLIVAEAIGGDAADYYIRTLISEGKIRHAVTLQNPNTGKFETDIVELDGPIALLQTTTTIKINPENRTRLIEIHPDESIDQTHRIHEQQKLERTEEGRKLLLVRREIIYRHQNAQRLLKPLDVVIPYAPLIEFASPKYTLRVRRDLPKFLDLISVIAVLRQHQKKVEASSDGSEYILADLEDYRIAHDLAIEIFREALDDIPAKSRELFNIIIEGLTVGSSGKSSSGDNFTRRDVRAWTGWPDSTIRKYLKPLEQEQYLTIEEGGIGGKPIRYSGEIDERTPANAGLLSCEELAEKIRNGKNENSST